MNGDMFPDVRVGPEVDPDRRYTTRETMDLCRKLAMVDEWHLDVAADVESHWAERWYCAPGDPVVPWLGCLGADGLKQSWAPPLDHLGAWNVWANIPFSNIEPWIEKAWATATRASHDELSRADVTIAVLVPANRTEQPWWHKHVEPYRDERWRKNYRPTEDARTSVLAHRLTTHCLPSRVRYGHPGNPSGAGAGSPPFASMLLVWRPNE